MDAETLERLLMDRALGALGPDVEALLDEHLAQDPEGCQRAAEFAGATSAARQALGAGVPLRLPEFPALRLATLERTRRRLAWVRNTGAVAATLVVGIWLGGLLTSGRPGPDTPVSGAGERTALAASAPAHADADGGFWSVARLVDRSRQPERSRALRLIWDSPAERPHLGGKS